MTTHIKRAARAANDVAWHCLLPRGDVPELFHAVFRTAHLPGHDEQGLGCWRQYDEYGQLIHEVRGPSGVLSAQAHPLARALIECAFEQFPEAFGRCSPLAPGPNLVARQGAFSTEIRA